LRVRLVVLVTLGVLPSLGVIAYTDLEQRGAAREEAVRDALRVARHVAGVAGEMLEGGRRLSAALAEALLQTGVRPRVCAASVTRLLGQFPDYANFGAATADGRVVCSARPMAAPVSIADRDYFRRAVAERRAALSDVIEGRVVGRRVVALGVPAVDTAGVLQAVVFVSFDLAALPRLAAEAALPPGSRVLLVDRAGTLLARHPEDARVPGQPAAWAPFVQAARAGPEATLEAPGLDGERCLWGVREIAGSEGRLHVAVGIPEAEVVAARRRILARSLGRIGLAAALALVAALWAGQRFVRRPVNALVEAAGRLGRGHPGLRTGIRHDPGEIGRLARALDDTAQAVEARQAQLGAAERGRYEAERRLEEAEEFVWLILEGVRDHAVFMLDAEGRIATWHTGARRVTGLGAPEALGQPLAHLFPPEDRPAAARLLAEARDRAAASRDGRLQRADGTGFLGELELTALWEERTLRGYTAVIRDVTEGRRAETELRALAGRLEQLSRQLLALQESERRAIARELHDEAGQLLTALKINLQASERELGGPSPRALKESLEIVDELIQRVRELSLDLRPAMLDDWGLDAALRWYAERLGAAGALEVAVESSLGSRRLPPEVETACFRVAQEGLTNALRHAHARRVTVRVEADADTVCLGVHDDGRGFDVAGAEEAARAGRSLGLLGMAERARLLGGVLEIDSAPGAGTTVRARLPLGAAS
jgi:PAS domain S-box-containing protein